MKFPLRATIAFALTLSGLVGAVNASATSAPTVKIVQGNAYGFNAVSDVGSNGAHVFAVNSAGNSVTELDASTGNVVNLFKNRKFGFDGPAHLSDDWTNEERINQGVV